MPNSSSGFSGNELVSYVINWIGNTSSEFQTFIEQTLPLAEFRFCKAHNWRFLNKQNLSLTVASPTVEYSLTSSTIGYYMTAENVNQIFSVTKGVYLKKTSLDAIRRMDPDQNDGGSTANLTHWCPVGDNSILLYPPTYSDTALKVDGKITPSALLTLSGYPTIPYRYQESFLTYLISLALDRENDDRAPIKKQEALALMRADIQDDMGSLGDTDLPRIKHEHEAYLDGVSANLESLYTQWMWQSS